MKDEEILNEYKNTITIYRECIEYYKDVIKSLKEVIAEKNKQLHPPFTITYNDTSNPSGLEPVEWIKDK